MLQSTKTRFRNELLRLMGQDDLALLEPHFERMSLKLKTVLQRSGAPIEFVYFPENCIASLVAKIPKGRDAEVGFVGFEGMTGNGASEPGAEGEKPAEEGTVEGEFREV